MAQAGTIDLGAATRTFTISDGSPAVDVSILAAIIGTGGLTKAGAGTLQLSGVDTYTGGTIVTDGMLTLSGAAAKLGTGNVVLQASVAGSAIQIQTGVSNAIANTANLSLSDGSSPASGLSAGFAAALAPNRTYVDVGAGINETVNMLLLNGVAQGPGTYGSSTSSATFKNDNFFAGSGVITVLIPEPTTASLLLLGLASLAARRRRR